MTGSDRNDGADPHRRAGDYRAARIGAASALTAVLIVLLIADALSPDYAVDVVVAYGLLGTIAGLLGVEPLVNYFRGGR